MEAKDWIPFTAARDGLVPRGLLPGLAIEQQPDGPDARVLDLEPLNARHSAYGRVGVEVVNDTDLIPILRIPS